MKILNAFWRYWKWLCVALVTTCILLAIPAYFIMYMDMPEPDRPVRECIESGGTWDDGAGICKAAG